MLNCCLEHAGMSDYWGGMGDRGRGKGCAFASYDHSTTLRDLVDQWVDDVRMNDYDFEDLPESIGDADIRECIIGMFNAKGLADYESGALCEWAAYCEDERVCDGCGAGIGEEHEEDCEIGAGYVEDDDCQDYNDFHEYPQAIICIDWTDHPAYTCPGGCGNKANHDNVNGYCGGCAEEYGTEQPVF
jgi:hypothetical protein